MACQPETELAPQTEQQRRVSDLQIQLAETQLAAIGEAQGFQRGLQPQLLRDVGLQRNPRLDELTSLIEAFGAQGVTQAPQTTDPTTTLGLGGGPSIGSREGRAGDIGGTGIGGAAGEVFNIQDFVRAGITGLGMVGPLAPVSLALESRRMSQRPGPGVDPGGLRGRIGAAGLGLAQPGADLGIGRERDFDRDFGRGRDPGGGAAGSPF